MSDIKQLAAMAALNHMMSQSYFSICAIDSVAKLMQINPKGEAYDTLLPLHCVVFDKMPQELRDAIPDLIRQCLGVAPTYRFQTLQQEVIDVGPAKKLLRFFGSAP